MEHFIKKLEIFTDNLPARIIVNKIEIWITFKTKVGYYLKLLTLEKWILGGTKYKLNQNGENLPHLEISEVVLIHCNSISNNYQHDSRVMYTFVPNKLFGQSLDI